MPRNIDLFSCIFLNTLFDEIVIIQSIYVISLENSIGQHVKQINKTKQNNTIKNWLINIKLRIKQ